MLKTYGSNDSSRWVLLTSRSRRTFSGRGGNIWGSDLSKASLTCRGMGNRRGTSSRGNRRGNNSSRGSRRGSALSVL